MKIVFKLLIAALIAPQLAFGYDGTIGEVRGTKIKNIHDTPTHVRIQATRLLEFRGDVNGDIQTYPNVIAWIDNQGKVRYTENRRANVKAFSKGTIKYLALTGICDMTTDFSPGKCLALEEQRDGDVHVVVFATRRNQWGVVELLQGTFVTTYGRDDSCTKREIRRGTAYCDVGGRSSTHGLAKRLSEEERDRSVIYTKETRVY